MSHSTFGGLARVATCCISDSATSLPRSDGATDSALLSITAIACHGSSDDGAWPDKARAAARRPECIESTSTRDAPSIAPARTDEGAAQHAEYMPACWSAELPGSESHGNARRLNDGDGHGGAAAVWAPAPLSRAAAWRSTACAIVPLYPNELTPPAARGAAASCTADD